MLTLPIPAGRVLLVSRASIGRSVQYMGATIAPLADGTDNHIAHLQLSQDVTATGGDYESGWTFYATYNGVDYEIDSDAYTITLHGSDASILIVTNTGDYITWHGGHGLKATYSSVTGKIRTLSGAEMQSFQGVANYVNQSTVNLLDQALLGYTMNEATGNREDVISTFDLEPFNSVGSALGRQGNAVKLNGTNQYLIADYNAAMNPANGEFEGYFRFKLNRLDQVMVFKSRSNTNLATGREYHIMWDSTTQRMRLLMTPDGTLTHATVVLSDTFGAVEKWKWYACRYWHDPTNDLAGVGVYDAGSALWDEDTGAIVGGVYVTANDLEIGAINGGAENFVNGVIDGVYQRKKLSTASEKAAYWAAGVGVDPPFIPGNYGTRYLGVTIAPLGDGTDNGIAHLTFSSTVFSPGSNYELGWTIKTIYNNVKYTLDPADYAITRSGSDDSILIITLTGTVAKWQGAHGLWATYDAATGDLRDADAVDIESFTEETTLIANTSTINLLYNAFSGYPLNDDNWLDVIGTRHLTEYNAPTVVAAKPGNGVSLNGTDRFLQRAHDSGLNFADKDREVLFWVKFNSLANNPSCVTKDDVSSPVREFNCFYFSSSNRLRLAVSSDGAVTDYTKHADTFGAMATGTFYCCRVWRSGTGNLIGVAVRDSVSGLWDADTLTMNPPIYSGTANFNIGTITDGASNFFNGVMGAVYIRDALSSTAELESFYNANNGADPPFIPDYTNQEAA